MSEKTNYNRLNKYFMKHYGRYEVTAEWYPDNTNEKWHFGILEEGLDVYLYIDSEGRITEEITQ